MATSFQTWVAVVGALLTAILTILRYFSERSRREKASTVGKAFSSTVDGLSAPEKTKQLAAAVLLRRFFDPHAEQGASGQPYQREAVSVIAALLRTNPSQELQKLLADGLAYAESLAGVDLQYCNLSHAYWGARPRPPITNGALRMLSNRSWPLARPKHEEPSATEKFITLTDADLSYADLSGASLRRANAARAVFRRGTATRTVFEQADLTESNFKEAKLQDADFRRCILTGAQFTGAQLHGARFEGAVDIPQNVKSLLDTNGMVSGVPDLRVGPG